MTADPSPLDPADEEEVRAAAALEAALEGRAANISDVPDGALEAAALLRFSTQQGQLSTARRSSIRAELLAALPEPQGAAPRMRLGWVFLPLGLLGAAFAALLVVKSGSEPTASSVAVAPGARSDEREQAPGARGEAAAPPAAEAVTRSRAEGSRAAESEWKRSARLARAELVPALQQPKLVRAHELADRASTPLELEQASRVLAALAVDDAAFPTGDVEARWARQDLFCRLAEVALRQGQPRSALEWTARGLALDGPDSAFLAQLHALDGEAKGLLGDETGAAASYMKALRINERLLQDSLGDSDAPPTGKGRKP